LKTYRTHVLICAGTACVSNESMKIKIAFEREIKKQGLEKEVQVIGTGCNGFCERGPVAVIQPDDVFYQQLRQEDIPYLVEEHFLKGRPVKKLMYVPEKDEKPIPKMMDIDFFRHQRLIVLQNRGRMDPEKIDEYIGFDGYTALAKALTAMSPKQITDEIKKSGLRGRGGAGFPTGLKWELCRGSKGKIKYLICNADEGDPGAYMDRSILEADPHAVLEGMTIGAKAIGAHRGFIYVRDEYPLAVQRVKTAIEQATDYGLLGQNILNTGFAFEVEVVRGGGAFVCGEETALMASIEGKVGRPRSRPPYPSEKGLWGNPTNINNVETWANVPVIISRGAEWYTTLGTGKSKGTKVFSLVGKVRNSGLVEVPMGITLREIIFDIGGGIPGGKKFKAVQSGGPSGGCIPEHLLDLPVDYEALTKAGAIMGSGGLIVMDEETCMVDVALYFVSFLVEESCGKCTPCRVGLQRMQEILISITKGEGKEGDIKKLEKLSEVIQKGSLCGLGQTAPNPVLTTLKYFKDEYEAHIHDLKCPAGVCKALITYHIDKHACTGCGVCLKACPEKAITGEKKQPHVIDGNLCTKCGSCYEVCKFNAVVIK
jgi:NADH:ubiquinone oxidoreductase subunit F (NADH-binding)/(2Fe-2S) ferredoxin/NAD-dependent dihydropyrimidine dehydrogenase PreA subunit